jgi:hypothetical protein
MTIHSRGRKIRVIFDLKETHEMKTLLALAILAAPLAAQAQTLNFYDRISGTSTTLLSGTVGPVDDLPLETVPFFGSITGSITLDGSAGVSYDVTLNERGSGGPGIFATNVFSLSGQLSSCGSAGLYCGELGNIQLLINSKGALIGAHVDVNNGEVYHTPSSDISISSPGGTSGSFFGYLGGAGCQAAELTNFSNGDGTYSGPTVKNCTVTVNSAQPGHWTQTPKINPSAAVGALTLLVGGIVVFRGKRPSALAA